MFSSELYLHLVVASLSVNVRKSHQYFHFAKRLILAASIHSQILLKERLSVKQTEHNRIKAQQFWLKDTFSENILYAKVEALQIYSPVYNNAINCRMKSVLQPFAAAMTDFFSIKQSLKIKIYIYILFLVCFLCFTENIPNRDFKTRVCTKPSILCTVTPLLIGIKQQN